MNPLRRVVLGILFLLFVSATIALADPPGRVARLQYMSGSVSIQPNGADEWVAGTLNRPLTNSDNVWTDKDSRAELNLGTGIMRMNASSSLTLTNISNSTIQVQLHQGTLNLRIRRLYDGEIYEVDTPNLAFTVQKPGEYRFDVDPEGDATVVTVWKGEGDATGQGPAVRVRSHEQARFTDGTSLAHEIHGAPGFDGFDDWCRVRDQRQDHALSARYVSPGVIGYEDLDDYGTWRVVPAYGPIWVPVVATGWAPYHYGHWIWVDPWGWTWVDDAPWGFAPFHYGRWVHYGGYWGWAPGPVYVRPVYAPALVAWFGGRHWGVGLSFGFGGGIGWCPLGFGEPFFPWYGASRGYFRNVNITNTNITNITNITNNYYNNGPRAVPPIRYANLKAPGGVTAVPRDVLANSRPVAREAVPVPANALGNARGIGRVPVEPTRTSALGINAGKPAVVPPARTLARPVVSRLAPPSTPPRFGGKQVASLNNADRALPGGVTGKPAGSPSTAPGRFVPRPPQPGEGPVPAAMRSRTVPQPPSPADRGAQPIQPGARRSVPRPPESNTLAANRRVNDFPRPSGSGAARPSDRTIAPSPSFGSRPVPRPPVERNTPSRPSVEQRNVPRPPEGTGQARTSQAEAPRPSGRVMPPMDSHPRDEYHPRYEPPRSFGAPRSYAESPGYSPRDHYADAPRYSAPDRYGESPRYSAPSRPRGSGPSPGRMSAPSYHGFGPSPSGHSGTGGAPSRSGHAAASNGRPSPRN